MLRNDPFALRSTAPKRSIRHVTTTTAVVRRKHFRKPSTLGISLTSIMASYSTSPVVRRTTSSKPSSALSAIFFADVVEAAERRFSALCCLCLLNSNKKRGTVILRRARKRIPDKTRFLSSEANHTVGCHPLCQGIYSQCSQFLEYFAPRLELLISFTDFRKSLKMWEMNHFSLFGKSYFCALCVV